MPGCRQWKDRDKMRFKIGNYFLDSYEAREKQKAFFALLSKRKFIDKVKALMI